MSELLDLSIQAVKTAKTSFCRFITGNDAGTTGSHQAGFYIPKNAAPLLFGEKCHKGENREKWVTIKWQNDIETSSRFMGKEPVMNTALPASARVLSSCKTDMSAV